MADDKGLHLVEFSNDRDDYPVVVASPSNGVVRDASQVSADENLDFQMYVHNGHVVQTQKANPPWYLNTFGYEIYKRKWDYFKNRQKVRVQQIAKYGALESFLTQRERERLAKLRMEHFKSAAAEAEAEMAAEKSESVDNLATESSQQPPPP